MTRTNKLVAHPLNAGTLTKTALLGAGIAYMVITIFLLVPGVTPNPNWPKFWMLRPLLVVPFAGAVGGIFYYFMSTLGYQGGWKKIVAIVVSLLVYIIGLWLGTVLGLAGTLWH